jgi:tetratricopeptide (TPR) repeat protein
MTIPLRVAGIGLILLALVWLQVQGPRDSQLIWALPIGLALGVLFIYFLKYRPARARLQLLHSGKHDEFRAANDKVLAQVRSPRRRAVLLMNQAAAFSQVGEFEKGVELHEQINVKSLGGTMECRYYLNLLHMLAYCDPERARSVREEHRDLLDPETHPRLKSNLVDVARTYELLVEDDHSGEDYFREKIRSAKRVQRAFGFYHLAVLLAQRGESELALQTYKEGQDYWPPLKLPSPIDRLTAST